MPNWQDQARIVARKHGIPEDLFLRLVKQESGFNPKARSGAGAIGLTQLMPGTAQGLGVDPNDPYQNLEGGARYLSQQKKKFGKWNLALSAYNSGPGGAESSGQVEAFPETQRYVRNIMGGANLTVPSALSSGLPGAPVPASPDMGLIGSLLQANNDLIGAPGLPADLFSGLNAPSLPRRASKASKPLGPITLGDVTLAAGADRSGVQTGAGILGFAKRVAGVFGSPLTITTGTNHNEFVKGTHRQSAHWQGNAADIAASGAELTRLGRAALVAAGMNPKVAAKKKGGLFNVGGFQVIFNSNVGGNHYNHLHIGLRH